MRTSVTQKSEFQANIRSSHMDFTKTRAIKLNHFYTEQTHFILLSLASIRTLTFRCWHGTFDLEHMDGFSVHAFSLHLTRTISWITGFITLRPLLQNVSLYTLTLCVKNLSSSVSAGWRSSSPLRPLTAGGIAGSATLPLPPSLPSSSSFSTPLSSSLPLSSVPLSWDLELLEFKRGNRGRRRNRETKRKGRAGLSKHPG